MGLTFNFYVQKTAARRDGANARFCGQNFQEQRKNLIKATAQIF